MLPRHPTSTLFPYTTLFRSPVNKARYDYDAELVRLDHYFTSSSRSFLTVYRNHRDEFRSNNALQGTFANQGRSEEHTSELRSLRHLVCRLLLEKKKHTTPRSSDSAHRRSIDSRRYAPTRPPAMSGLPSCAG